MTKIRFLYLGVPTVAELTPAGWRHPLPAVVELLAAHGHDAGRVAARLNGEVLADGVRDLPQADGPEGDPEAA